MLAEMNSPQVPERYRCIGGILNDLTLTRPEISF